MQCKLYVQMFQPLKCMTADWRVLNYLLPFLDGDCLHSSTLTEGIFFVIEPIAMLEMALSSRDIFNPLI